MKQTTKASGTTTKGSATKAESAKTAQKPTAAKAEAGFKIPDALDLRKLLEKLKLPGVDVNALLDYHRKDVETLIAANEQAFRGYQALTRRQAEILAEAMREWREGTAGMVDVKGIPEKASRTAGRAQQAFGQALGNMREIADLAAKSHEQVINILNKRVHEGLDGLRDSLRKHA